jgi:hypothetical protein
MVTGEPSWGRRGALAHHALKRRPIAPAPSLAA